MPSTVTWARVKSPWVLHFNSGACNGCDIEIVALLTPKYDVERFGIKLEPSPRHADVLFGNGLCDTAMCRTVKTCLRPNAPTQIRCSHRRMRMLRRSFRGKLQCSWRSRQGHPSYRLHTWMPTPSRSNH